MGVMDGAFPEMVVNPSFSRFHAMGRRDLSVPVFSRMFKHAYFQHSKIYTNIIFRKRIRKQEVSEIDKRYLYTWREARVEVADTEPAGWKPGAAGISREPGAEKGLHMRSRNVFCRAWHVE